MENWKTHILSFIVISAFLFVALASEDDDYTGSGVLCWDPSLVLMEPLPANDGHAVNYQVKIIDKETSQPISDITVDVGVIAYNCLKVEVCPDKCSMNSVYQDQGHSIGLTNSSGIISHTVPNWKASDKKDRLKLDITVKDESLLQYAYKRKIVLVGENETSVSVTIALIKDLY